MQKILQCCVQIVTYLKIERPRDDGGQCSQGQCSRGVWRILYSRTNAFSSSSRAHIKRVWVWHLLTYTIALLVSSVWHCVTELHGHGIWVIYRISWRTRHVTVSGVWSVSTHTHTPTHTQQQPQCSLETTRVTLCTRKTPWIKVSVRINYMLYSGLVCTRHLAVVQTQGAWPFQFSW